MSFTPDIIFDRKDLQKQTSVVEKEYWDFTVGSFPKKGRRSQEEILREQCIEKLYNLINSTEKQISFKKVEFTIMEVEGSTSNRIMREILDELKVPYTIIY